MSERPKGHITREATVWCGTCARWHQQTAYHIPSFKKEMKAQGWKLTRNHGWMCPCCVDEWKGVK